MTGPIALAVSWLYAGDNPPATTGTEQPADAFAGGEADDDDPWS